MSLRVTIEIALKGMQAWTPEAAMLLEGTAAQESGYGKYRRQLGGGPALGVFQMELATHTDCWENYLKYKPELARRILDISGMKLPDCKSLETNDVYAACMCRVKYMRDKQPIPADIEEQARYWKRVYNTPFGKGKAEEYVANYNRYVK